MLLALLACAPETTDTPNDAALADPLPLAVLAGDGLTADAEAALLRMPAWLRPDLRLALSSQKTARQDELAAVVLGVDDPYLLDEVGFALAHLSPEVLKQDNFHPELVVENARLIYEVDPLLEYVALVEEGDPEVDADWRTTTRYQVEVDGVVTTYDLDPDLYYWFIVHPRIEDENPWYIDAWDECTRSTLECAAEPDTGHFWRSFLWSAAAETCPDGEACPIVQDYLPGARVLWGAADGDDAVHRVAGMLLDSPGEQRWMSFGAYGERSIQPNRIYALGRGNCGEWADMTTAIARTALIPNVNVTPSSWDHTWNAFYTEDRWIAWEPVNGWFDHPYGSGYATYATRGDASAWYQTEQYTENVGTLEVTVLDRADRPVDGATVALWSPYDTSWWYAGELVTDLTGAVSIPVGSDVEFAYLAASDLAEDYVSATTNGVAAGTIQSVTLTIDARLPRVPEPASAGSLGALAVSVAADVAGRVIGASYRHEDRSSQPGPAPSLQTWLLSWEEYDAFVNGEDFSSADALDPEVGGVVVVANLASNGTAAIGTVTVTTSAPDTTDGALQLPVALWPQAWIAVAVGGD